MEWLGPGMGHGNRMKPPMWLNLFVAVATTTVLAVMAVAQDDDTFTTSLKITQRAEALILARCSLCHTHDLIYQQRLPQERWRGTVEKMQLWGAQLSNDEASLLIRYLSARYHPGTPDDLPPLDNELGKAEPLTHEPAAVSPLIGMSGRGGGDLRAQLPGLPWSQRGRRSGAETGAQRDPQA